ncbi:MAG: hypothetical protein IKP00_02225 [Victivallales bacterium]|nr:hypothetical protein [Victivallales bacterium]
MADDEARELEKLKGTVVFLQANQGSKSEGGVPCLYIKRGEIVKLLLRDDNPFENKGLLPYDGKYLEVAGKRKSNGTFIVEQISEASIIAAPAQTDAEDIINQVK